jgi:methyl-accepting chemotaxis protein
MLDTIAEFGSILFAGAALVALLIGGHFLRRARQLVGKHATMINNMTQGVCMFDKDGRLILYNDRYLAMYGVAGSDVRPGITLSEIIDLRYKAGTSPKMKKSDYVNWRSSIALSDKEAGTIVELANGQIFEIRHKPLPDGGYVATHEDITALQLAEREKTITGEQEKRRAGLEGAIAAFRDSVEAVLTEVKNDAAALRATALGLAAASKQASECTAIAVKTSIDASSSVGAASSSAEELSASISAIAGQVRATAQLVETSVEEATKANNEISALTVTVGEIGNIVKLIQDVSGQTNLLSLNATIEAARAGEIGKGFAVVASEVKSLAVQSAKAADQIAGQILSIQESSSTAIDAIHQNAARMQEINERTSEVAAGVSQQDVATGQILSNVSNAFDGARKIRDVLQELDHATAETSNSADRVLAASARVEKVANDLHEEVARFLRKVN